MTSFVRKAINFDLDTKKLKQHYPNKSLFGYKKAYTDIKRFMENNGFEHRQWSGYISKSNIDSYDISNIIAKMSLKFPWLKKCVNKFDVTDIGEEYDLTSLINEPDKVLANVKSQKNLDKMLAKAKTKADIHNKEITNKQISHKNNNIEL